MICSDENMRLLVRTRQKSLMITDVFVECSMGSNASYQLLKTKVVAEPRCGEPTPIQLLSFRRASCISPWFLKTGTRWQPGPWIWRRNRKLRTWLKLNFTRIYVEIHERTQRLCFFWTSFQVYSIRHITAIQSSEFRPTDRICCCIFLAASSVKQSQQPHPSRISLCRASVAGWGQFNDE